MPTPGPLELVIILVIALIILGPGKLPDVGASLGKSIREFRKASSDLQEAATVKVDTSPLPPQAPVEQAPVAQAPLAPMAPVQPAPQAPIAQAPVMQAPVVQAPVMQATEAQPAVATAAPYAQPVPADVPAPAAAVPAGTASRDSGTEASS
jgi:TatA/E family protein of Tat protein translocase